MTTSTPIAVTFTGKGIETILSQGGSASWRLNRNRARLCAYVVCTRNTKAEWSEGQEEHGSAFLIGRVRDVVAAPEKEDSDRFLFEFSEYALLCDMPNRWTGDRYPVHYTTLEAFGINPTKLDWRPMPGPDPVSLAGAVPGPYDVPGEEDSPMNSMHDGSEDRPLTMAQAKRGLALTFGISPEAVEITIRG